MSETKNYFAGERPDSAPNYFTTPQSDLTSELCELCTRFGALHEALNILDNLEKSDVRANIKVDLQLHCITLYFTCQDLLVKYRQLGADDAQVAEFSKTLSAELRRMKHE